MSKVSKVLEIEKQKNLKEKKIEKSVEKKIDLEKNKLTQKYLEERKRLELKSQKDFIVFKKLISLKIEKKFQDLDNVLENIEKNFKVDKFLSNVYEENLKWEQRKF